MIHVQDLQFTYSGETTPTIRGINFDIQKGEIFGFLGPSGAGKSTTQKILIRLLKNFEGSVSVLGKDLRSWGAEYYNHIGVGFELPNHYTKLTALENLQFFASFYDKPTRNPVELLEMVGLKAEANKKVAEFSKGMKMRLNFVRAMLHDPEIIFMDEPTSGLDPTNGRNLKNIIRELRENGTTFFITTHNMNDADELCDRVGFIVDGSIALIDSPRELKLQKGESTVAVEYLKDSLIKQEFPLKGIGENEEFLQLLKSDQIQTLHTGEATLEEIFIKVTGRELG